MSPRRNRRRDQPPAVPDPRGTRMGIQSQQSGTDGDWYVRGIPGPAAVKTYRCPGCDHEIRPGVGHIVAWPADGRGDASDRRHWHRGCWGARERRLPTGWRARS